MSAQPLSKPISVAEYEKIPSPAGGRYDLRHGELVLVTWPVWNHKELRRRLRKVLEPMAEPMGYIVGEQYPYRPLPENEIWGADVACISEPRYRVPKWLEGSPELVIEVKSPSNSPSELKDHAMTTLAGEGSLEFWIVDLETRSVTVYNRLNGMYLYTELLDIPVPLFGGRIQLTHLFQGL